MRIIGLLSWYDEPVPWLAECVAGLARLCDHLIAVDGPYAAFPGALRHPASAPVQADVIAHTAAGAGIGCTIHTPRQPWWGGEVGKRDFMFRLGMTMAEPGVDWFLRIDADEMLIEAPPEARKQLAATEHDVAEVILTERAQQQAADAAGLAVDYRSPLRALFRALPGIAIEQAHYVVTAPSDTGRRILCGNTFVHRQEMAEPLWDVVLDHRTRQRSAARQQAKRGYDPVMAQIEQLTPFEENQ